MQMSMFINTDAKMVFFKNVFGIPQKSFGPNPTGMTHNLLSLFMQTGRLSIPDSLCEAAKIDGCGPFGIFTRIVLPLTKSGLATLIILTFNNVWNDYMGPMIYLDSDKNRTIQLGLATFKREFDTNYGAIMAGTVISLIPIVIVYVIAQKYIVEGIAYSGVKG